MKAEVKFSLAVEKRLELNVYILTEKNNNYLHEYEHVKLQTLRKSDLHHRCV